MKTKKEIITYLKNKFSFTKENLDFYEWIFNIIFQLDFKISFYAMIADKHIEKNKTDENNVQVFIFSCEKQLTLSEKEKFEISLDEYLLSELEGINRYSLIYTLNQIIVTFDFEY